MPRYEFVPEKSRVIIEGRSSLHPIHSSTDGLEGFFDPDTGQGRVSFAVSRLRSGNPLEEREMKRRIDARRFPTIDGVLTSYDAAGDATGDLTFRGVTKAVAGELTVEPVDDDTIEVSGESTFDVRDFGMQPPRVLMLRVHPDVKVRIEIVARRAGS
jgi:polyisoprenoid-binding protein YceI